MIAHDVEQGTQEWYDLRRGIPTGSGFSRIITPTGQQSKQADEYIHELLGEVLCSDEDNVLDNLYWIARGKELEPKAAALYELQNDVKTFKTGFITNDDMTAGVSLDRIVGNDGAIEIKCPCPKTHLSAYFAKEIDAKYKPQVQGQIWIAEREWVEWISYHPELPMAQIRVYRDEDYLKKFEKYLTEFNEKLMEKLNQLKGEI